MSTIIAALGAWFFVLLVCYFIPAIIAVSRGHKDVVGIIALNILLGWTVLGWIVAFVWSVSDAKGRDASQTVVVHTAQHNVAAHAAPTPAAPPTHDADTAFWDGLPNKSDRDCLEEYLMRFPQGRFASLARTRLERSGALPAAPTPDAPSAKEERTVCARCGAFWEAGSRFCGECGTPEPAMAPA